MANESDAILVVDDRAQDLFAISTVLDGADYEVLTASTGGEASASEAGTIASAKTPHARAAAARVGRLTANSS